MRTWSTQFVKLFNKLDANNGEGGSDSDSMSDEEVSFFTEEDFDAEDAKL